MKKNIFFSLNLPDKIFGFDKELFVLFLKPIGLILLFLISLNLILMPKISEIGAVNGEINKINLNTKKNNEQNKYLMSINQEELKKNADYLDNAVLKDKKSYLLVEIIRGVANNFNYQINSFSLTPGELKVDESNKISEDMVKMPVTLSMVGPKEKSLELISALEKTLPILFIDKFETKNTGTLSQLDLIVSSYYVKDNINMETSNVSLSDLILSKDEVALITKISSFTKIERNNEVGVGSSNFQQYQRENPFSP